MKSIAVRLIAGVFILFGGLFLYGGMRNLLIGNASKTWPTVSGKVISSTVESEHRNRSGINKKKRKDVTTYHAAVLYEYTVNGTTRSSNDIAFGGYSSSDDPAHARVIADKYPPGSQVTVYYSPSHPSMAVLEPGIREHSLFPLVFGAFFSGMGIIAFIFLPSSIQRRRQAGVTAVPAVTIR